MLVACTVPYTTLMVGCLELIYLSECWQYHDESTPKANARLARPCLCVSFSWCYKRIIDTRDIYDGERICVMNLAFESKHMRFLK